MHKYLDFPYKTYEEVRVVTERVAAQVYHSATYIVLARRGGVEVAGWTLDRTIRVRFPAYPHHVLALWWQGGKRRLRTFRCPGRGRPGTLKTPSCPWRWVPGSRLKFGNWTSVPSLYSWNIAECDVKPQSTNQPISFCVARMKLHNGAG